jgi:hypothetical protein
MKEFAGATWQTDGLTSQSNAFTLAELRFREQHCHFTHNLAEVEAYLGRKCRLEVSSRLR